MRKARRIQCLRNTVSYLSFGLRIGVGAPTKLQPRQLCLFGGIDLVPC